MTWYQMATVLSYTILPATVMAIFKYRQCRQTYLPLLLLLVAATVNEIISTLIIRQNISNAINNNVYVLVECWLLIWLFRNWEPGPQQKWLYPLLAMIAGMCWLLDNVVLHSIHTFNSMFRIMYALLVFSLSSDQLSYVLINEKKIFNSPRFILCVSFMVTYCYKIFVELFIAVNPGFGREFYQWFFVIWVIINVMNNICFTLAVLWIPRKEKYYITYY